MKKVAHCPADGLPEGLETVVVVPMAGRGVQAEGGQ